MELSIGALACALLAFVVVAIHDETLQYVTHRFLPSIPHPRRWHVGATVLILLAAHVGEIVVCAAALFATVRWLHLGGIGGIGSAANASFATYVYFSASCYTSLGFGDVYPIGALRLIAGMEALFGLLMLGWSASFLLLEMREFRALRRPDDR